MSGYQTIRYRREGDVGTLTLARPAKRNAQNPLMWEELAGLGRELLPDQSLRCLVVTAEGPVFSAGIDLVEGMGGLLARMAERPGVERPPGLPHGQRRLGGQPRGEPGRRGFKVVTRDHLVGEPDLQGPFGVD